MDNDKVSSNIDSTHDNSIEEKPRVEIVDRIRERIPIKRRIYEFYDKKYKILLIIPLILLFLSLVQIGYQFATTGDFLIKGVSLKGGITLTIPLENEVNIIELEENILTGFPENDINVRTLQRAGVFRGLIIEADIDATDEETFNSFISAVRNSIDEEIGDDLSVEVVGSSLGASFFRETFFIILISFLFMGIVVFFYFRSIAPSIAIILAAFSDMVMTLAVINLLGVKLSTAGIAGFIMLIGYSVDTDILLSTRVLKRKEGTEMERVIGSVKTGLTMTITTLVAVLFAFFFSQSETLSQIMLIILIGLSADMINTWLQNVGIIRLYLERKRNKGRI